MKVMCSIKNQQMEHNQSVNYNQKYFSFNFFSIFQKRTMRQILNKSGAVYQALHSSKFSTRKLLYNFSAMPPNLAIQKAVEFQFKFRSILKLSQLNEYIEANKEDIKKYGKTILLQFLNEYPMQSFRRSRDQFDTSKRDEKFKMRRSIYMFLTELEDLNFYELNMRYSIFKKLLTYVGEEPLIMEEASRTENQLVDKLKTSELHVCDLMNWLFMLPLNYKPEHSCLAFDLLQKKFQSPQVRQYYKDQRSLPALIKRIYELDWYKLRKYKNLLKFIYYEVSLRQVDTLQETVILLERIVLMKLHLVGEKVIPKIVDDIMGKFDAEFEQLTKNKQTLLKVFCMFKYLPLSYNIKFFHKIHAYLKSTKQLPSTLMLYIPYNKLSSSEVAFLQSKMLAIGREDIASKLIYTIYEPSYKDILTPFIVKETYFNMLEMTKKDNLKNSSNYQIYLSLIFRFIKIRNSVLDQNKLKSIFTRMAYQIEENNFQVFSVFSIPAIISFLQLCANYDIHLNQKTLNTKIQSVLKSRKQRNTTITHTNALLSALKVHYNASHKKSRYLLTLFIKQIATNPEVDYSQKIQLLFLIQKTLNPQNRWSQFSYDLTEELTKDLQSFIEIYIKYEYKTLKLTNFVFSILYKRKAQFSMIIQLLSSLNIKLITSLKGKLISPLKKYISEMDLSKFDIQQCNITNILQSFRVLFYFKNQIPEFMEYFSMKIIQKIQLRCKQGQYVNGKQFASLSNYIMEVISKVEIKQKTSIIESIVSIIKTLRKKEGIYLKVYQLDFLCTNQKYIKINKDVLEHHWNDVIETLKKTDRIEFHKELMFIVVKLHCRQFVQLNQFDLRYFIENCIEMIERSSLNLLQIKQCLGYSILECEDSLVIEKMKIYLSGLVKLAFRKDKRKQNYFVYEYYLKFFSKLQSKQMIIQICEKLLYEKLYPVQVSNIVPILNKNQIKNKKFVQRILDIMYLSDNYVSYQKMQVMSWLQKIVYDLPQTDFNIKKLKTKVQQEIVQKTSALKLLLKNKLTVEDRSIESGFQVDDPDFDRNYKIFIQYAWTSLKNKNIDTPEFKFICRYLFFSIQRIKGRIQIPQERKQISKIKLSHVLKYIKEMGFFEVDNEKIENAVREKNLLKDKTKKNKLLNKMEKDLCVMKIETCQKLEEKLNSFADLIVFKSKHQIKPANQKVKQVVEYYLQEKSDAKNKVIKNKFIIHTVKSYHRTPQIDSVSSPDNGSAAKQANLNRKRQNEEASSQLKAEDNELLDVGFEENFQQIDNDELLNKLKDAKNSILEQSQLSLQLKPERELFTPKKSQKVVSKPLFSQMKNKKIEQKTPKTDQPSKFETVLKIQTGTQEICKDYNGYLKVQKSLIELLTGLKCIIYDPQKDIFFD